MRSLSLKDALGLLLTAGVFAAVIGVAGAQMWREHDRIAVLPPAIGADVVCAVAGG